MKQISKITKVVAKILEVFHWVGTVLLLCATICSLAAPQWVNKFVGFDAKECCGANLNVYGFEVNAPYKNGSVDMKVFFVFGIGAVIIMTLMAMIFRNIYLIVKKSENSTPFQKDNVRMLREIGIFSIAMPIVGFIMNTIITLIFGVDQIEMSVNQLGIFMGIAVLCITQFFSRGMQLEEDVEGLL